MNSIPKSIQTKGLNNHRMTDTPSKTISFKEYLATKSKTSPNKVTKISNVTKNESNDLRRSKPNPKKYANPPHQKMNKFQPRKPNPTVKTEKPTKKERGVISSFKTYTPLNKNVKIPKNRFNIKPGYFWDGIDRSIGFEKKFLKIDQDQKLEKHKQKNDDGIDMEI